MNKDQDPSLYVFIDTWRHGPVHRQLLSALYTQMIWIAYAIEHLTAEGLQNVGALSIHESLCAQSPLNMK